MIWIGVNITLAVLGALGMGIGYVLDDLDFQCWSFVVVISVCISMVVTMLSVMWIRILT